MSVGTKYKHYAEKIRIFQGLTPDEVYGIVRGGRMVDFGKGQTIFHEGMLGSNLCLLHVGGGQGHEIQVRALASVAVTSLAKLFDKGRHDFLENGIVTGGRGGRGAASGHAGAGYETRGRQHAEDKGLRRLICT